MAVPKKRTGRSAQGHRRSNWKATVPETTTCKNCGELVLTHTVCEKCGYYKGKVVSIKAEGYIAEDAASKAKKAPKAKKVEKVEKQEVTNEVVTPEVVAEETVAEAVVEEATVEEVKEETTEE